jgi:tetratricopeptide (TPR) repeat protein
LGTIKQRWNIIASLPRILNWNHLIFAELFTLMQQYDSAKYYYSLADTTNQRMLRSYLVITGECYFAQKQYGNALANFTRALPYHRQLNDINPVMRTLLDIAKNIPGTWEQ